MRTRNADKRTPPSRKAATKTSSPTTTPSSSATPKTSEGRRGSAANRAKQAKVEVKVEESPAEEVRQLEDADMLSPVKKRVLMRAAAKKRGGKGRGGISRKGGLDQMSKLQGSQEEEEEAEKRDESDVENGAEGEDFAVRNPGEVTKVQVTAAKDNEGSYSQGAEVAMAVDPFEMKEDSAKLKESAAVEVRQSDESRKPIQEEKDEETTNKENVESSSKEVDVVMAVDPTEKKGDSMKLEESIIVEVGESDESKESIQKEKLEEVAVKDNEKVSLKEAEVDIAMDPAENKGDSVKPKGSTIVDVGKSDERIEPTQKEKEKRDSTRQDAPVLVPSFENEDEEELDPEEEEETELVNEKVEPQTNSGDKVDKLEGDLQQGGANMQQDDYSGYEGFEEYGDKVDYGDHEEDEFPEDDMDEPTEETDILEEERRELKAITNDRRIKKELEIFVGGLDRDATEEDVKQVFERIGEIVEVRLHKNFSTNKNKGYAFVKFTNKEHAKKALSEMKNPVICGKRCGTAPSEDNDTLFVGNICNTWTKEAIKQKMKDYGLEGVENITLVPDVQHDGLSRGFAFVEFSCHVDAMAAYKRLQKPDVVFGHQERTVKVAFAEPLREPDPEVMAQVKTIFLDGVPPHWTEDQVREHISGYGEIVRIVLARNMSSAKRKDYGFVDFSTHEAAVGCISGINSKEIVDGSSKIKLKARLSNPMPKIQAVKGGLSGGFRIDRGGGATFSRSGRGLGHGGHHFHPANSHRGRGFHPHGRGQFTRMAHYEHGFGNRYNDFPGRPYIARGGRRGSFRGHHTADRAVVEAGPSRPNPNRHWHHGPDREHFAHMDHHMPYRTHPFYPEEDFDRPFIGRPSNDSYFYDDRRHGVKRPFYAMDHGPDYMGPSRQRPRMDYNDPAVPFHGNRYHESFGTGTGLHPEDYYRTNYGAYPPYHGDDHSYRGGYYY